MQNLARKALLAVIKGYKYILSPLLPVFTCRFYPTCSSYAYQAIKHHGVLKGTVLAAWRLLRCGPWSNGGHDPVPQNYKKGEHVKCNH